MKLSHLEDHHLSVDEGLTLWAGPESHPSDTIKQRRHPQATAGSVTGAWETQHVLCGPNFPPIQVTNIYLVHTTRQVYYVLRHRAQNRFLPCGGRGQRDTCHYGGIHPECSQDICTGAQRGTYSITPLVSSIPTELP